MCGRDFLSCKRLHAMGIWTVLLGVIVCIERVVFKKKQIKKLEQFIWQTGEVVSDIDGSHVVVEQM